MNSNKKSHPDLTNNQDDNRLNVIDFDNYRLERELLEKGITVKKNRENKVKMLLRFINLS